MSDAKLQSAVPVLPVADVSKAVAFYRDRLGFTPLFEYGPYAGVGRGPIEVHLDGSATGQSPVTCRFNMTGGTQGAGGVDEIYAELEKQEVIHPNEPLETKPFGMRQFSVLDCDGNRLTFAQNVQAPAAAQKRRFAITFTHIDGVMAQLKKEDLAGIGAHLQAWSAETDSQPRSSLVYFSPEAKTVRKHVDGRVEVLSGGFAGGKEAAGGFTIIEADSMDEALEYAKRHRWLPGSNEVREIVSPPGTKSWIRSH